MFTVHSVAVVADTAALELDSDSDSDPALELELSEAAIIMTAPSTTTAAIVVAVTTRPVPPASGRAGKALAPAALPAGTRLCRILKSSTVGGAFATGPDCFRGMSTG